MVDVKMMCVNCFQYKAIIKGFCKLCLWSFCYRWQLNLSKMEFFDFLIFCDVRLDNLRKKHLERVAVYDEASKQKNVVRGWRKIFVS